MFSAGWEKLDVTPNIYAIAPFLERASRIKSSHIVQMPQTSSWLFVLATEANLICFPFREDTFLLKKKGIYGNLVSFGSVHKDILIKVQNYFRFISFPLLFLEHSFSSMCLDTSIWVR